ncbi:MAG: amidohydrolase [Clostridiales bacterium]|nr:amidohydrolase [Clostridiales bacterium]
MGYILGNATIITVDNDRRIIVDGAIVIKDSIISDIGKTPAMKAKYKDYEFHDMDNHIIMPGLINGHVHLTQALIKGCADDVSLIDFLANRIWRLMGSYNEEEARVSADICLLEMIKSGTTTFVETLLLSRYGLDGITDAVIESGMRGVLAKSVMDIATYASKDNIMCEGMIEDGDICLEQAIQWKKKSENAGDGRINIWLGPRPVGSTTKDMLQKVSKTANKHDMGIAIHFCEVKQDVIHMKNNYDQTPGDFAESAGILTDRTMLAHGIWLTKDDMQKLKKHKTTVVHCPASNAKLASGFCLVPELLEEGVNVALGTDASTCDNKYDMFDAMRLAAIIHKCRLLDPLVIPAETAIEMATINGAKAMKKEHLLGSLEVGKKADIITIDCNNPRLIPNTNPVSMVVYSAQGTDVDNVIIDGKFIVKDREILTMDEQAIMDKAKTIIKQVLSKTEINNKSKWKIV